MREFMPYHLEVVDEVLRGGQEVVSCSTCVRPVVVYGFAIKP